MCDDLFSSSCSQRLEFPSEGQTFLEVCATMTCDLAVSSNQASSAAKTGSHLKAISWLISNTSIRLNLDPEV